MSSIPSPAVPSTSTDEPSTVRVFARPSIPSPRAYELRDAILQMTVRYGDAQQRAGYAGLRGSNAYGRARRVAQRRFRAILRLTAALRDLEAS